MTQNHDSSNQSFFGLNSVTPKPGGNDPFHPPRRRNRLQPLAMGALMQQTIRYPAMSLEKEEKLRCLPDPIHRECHIHHPRRRQHTQQILISQKVDSLGYSRLEDQLAQVRAKLIMQPEKGITLENVLNS